MDDSLRTPAAVLTGLALVGAGALFGNQSLYPAGIALVVLPLAALVWVRLASIRLRLDRVARGGAVVEGEPHPVEIGFRRGLLPPPGAELHDPLLERAVRLGPALRPVRAAAVFERRGRRPLGAAELTVADPLGFARRTVRSDTNAGELLVLPRTEPVTLLDLRAGGSALELGFGREGGVGVGPDPSTPEPEIDGLRPYRQGSPASRIHWPTVARTGELHELRLATGPTAARLLVLDGRRPAGPGELDDAVRAAASLALALARSGGCTVLLAGYGPLRLEPSLRGWQRVHAAFALAGEETRPPPLSRIGHAGLLVWVSADPSPQPERQAARVPARARVIVRPGPPCPESLLAVSGCEGRLLAGSHAGRRRADPEPRVRTA